MKTIIAGTSLFFSLLLFNSCASAKADTDVRESTLTITIDKPFSSVLAVSGIDITYTQNTEQSKAVITGPSKLVASVKWEIKDGRLCFVSDRFVDNSLSGLRVALNGNALKSFEAVSSGKLTVTTPVDGSDIKVAAASSGKVTFRQRVNASGNLDVQASSSGGISFQQSVKAGGMANVAVASAGKISGLSLSAESIARIAASSAADVNLTALSCDKAKIDASSSAYIQIDKCVAGSLSVGASSSGTVHVDGSLGTVSAIASSTGDVKLSGEAMKGDFTASSLATIDINNLKVNDMTESSSSSGGKIKRRKK